MSRPPQTENHPAPPRQPFRRAFLRGVIEGAPFVLVVAPFGLLFGVVGTEAGLSLDQVMGFSVLVIAGASQFAALQMIVDNAPTWLAVLTGLIVNLRMAMYSAALTPYLGDRPLWQRAFAAYFLVDQSYALADATFRDNPAMTPGQRVRYFFGIMVLIAPSWYGATLIGALIGARIPPEYALDFAVPITFLALVAPALRSLAHVVSALVATCLALLLVGLPYNSGLIVAALCAMAAGAQTELWLRHRGTP